MLMLGVNGAIEINGFFPIVNANVNADAQCEQTLRYKKNPTNILFVNEEHNTLYKNPWNSIRCDQFNKANIAPRLNSTIKRLVRLIRSVFNHFALIRQISEING